MGVFDDVVSNVKTTAGVVGKKATEYYDISKLKLSLIEVNREISKEYAKLGKFTYDVQKHGEDAGENIEETIQRIDSLFEQKSDISEKILIFLKKKKCRVCNEIVVEKYNFCPNCGEKFEDLETELDEGIDL